MISPRDKFLELQLDGSCEELIVHIGAIGAYLYTEDYIAAKAKLDATFDLVEELKRDLSSLERHIDAAKAVTR